jgi:alpha-1,3-glucan synthase
VPPIPGIVQALLVAYLAHLVREHSWLFPLLVISLGALRWAQILWGVSGLGISLP